MDEAQIRALPDDEFGKLVSLIQAEQARRFTLRQIPADIADLAAQFRDSGGDEQALADALTTDQH